jgi:hypothetical protein
VDPVVRDQLRPWQALAAAVIRQALDDLRPIARRASPTPSWDARRWAHHDALDFLRRRLWDPASLWRLWLPMLRREAIKRALELRLGELVRCERCHGAGTMPKPGPQHLALRLTCARCRGEGVLPGRGRPAGAPDRDMTADDPALRRAPLAGA